ncbi:unnamed protein product [marine sediment metagenome]|uniref:Uncharacterized protein n=1 Tax=marine sediment metagenome TaxID=412755 RepID=X0SQT5_9ZZZZ
MKTRFLITTYPDTESEITIWVEVGTVGEIEPNDKNFDHNTTYAFRIRSDTKGVTGMVHTGFKDRFRAEATAMLQAVSYGNGGFPLENMLS